MSHASFDCKAAAAVLESGGALTLAGHLAAALAILSNGPSPWIAVAALLVWCAIVYYAVRVKIDAGLFAVLADHEPEELDDWLKSTNLHANAPQKSLIERQRGALRLWRALAAAVIIEIVLALSALLLAMFEKARPIV